MAQATMSFDRFCRLYRHHEGTWEARLRNLCCSLRVRAGAHLWAHNRRACRNSSTGEDGRTAVQDDAGQGPPGRGRDGSEGNEGWRPLQGARDPPADPVPPFLTCGGAAVGRCEAPVEAVVAPPGQCQMGTSCVSYAPRFEHKRLHFGRRARPPPRTGGTRVRCATVYE